MGDVKRALPAPSAVRLYLVAGFPAPRDQQVVGALQQRFPPDRARFISVAAGKNSQRFYDRSVEALLRAAAGFAIRNRLSASAAWRPVVPSRLVLLYVRAADEERLLSAFEYFAYAKPIEAPRHGDPAPSGWRFDPRLVEAPVAAAVRALVDADLPPRLIARTDVRNLPPNNFHLRDKGKLADRFTAVRRGETAWADIEAEISPKEFRREDLPKAIVAKKARLHVDARGIVFPPALEGGEHGFPREALDNASSTELRSLLASLYRFGSVLDYGFHHDAQYAGGKTLDRVAFDCSRQGRIEVSATHANIYPDDYVRSG